MKNLFDELACAVCLNSYETDELTFVVGYLVCVFCAHDWQVEGKELVFEEWAVKHRAELEAEK